MATSVNIDRVHRADHGDLSVPAQSAGFVVDPMLAPINAHSTHVIKPDPSPSSDPELFDASTHQPKLHYHPEKKLGKKKKAKKLGIGHPQGPVHPASNVKGDLFTAHEKDAEHRQQVMQDVQARKEHQAQHLAEELQGSGSEYETDEDDTDNAARPSHAEEATQSKQQHASERTAGQEADKGKGTSHISNSTSTAGDSTGSKGDNKERSSSEENPSLLSRASEAATGLANKVMHTSVVSSAAEMMNTVLSKVGLKKSNEGDQHADDEHEKDKGNEGSQTKEVGQSHDESATKEGKKAPKPYNTTSKPANTDKQQSDETISAK